MYSLKYGQNYDDAVDIQKLGFYVQSHPVISPPEIQTKTVEVPGRDGLLNLSKALDGMVHYNNRTITVPLVYISTYEPDFQTAFARLQNELHGEETRLFFTDNESWYWAAFVSVGEPAYSGGYYTVSLSASAEPYSYAVNNDYTDQTWLWDVLDFETGYIPEPVSGYLKLTSSSASAWTTFNRNWTGTASGICETVTASAAMTIRYYMPPGSTNEHEAELKAGDNEITIPFEGTTTIKLLGVGTASFDLKWRSL